MLSMFQAQQEASMWGLCEWGAGGGGRGQRCVCGGGLVRLSADKAFDLTSPSQGYGAVWPLGRGESRMEELVESLSSGHTLGTQ